jgi:hypothetical protein
MTIWTNRPQMITTQAASWGSQYKVHKLQPCSEHPEQGEQVSCSLGGTRMRPVPGEARLEEDHEMTGLVLVPHWCLRENLLEHSFSSVLVTSMNFTAYIMSLLHRTIWIKNLLPKYHNEKDRYPKTGKGKGKQIQATPSLCCLLTLTHVVWRTVISLTL